jgi:ribonuclease H2 subunit A
LIADSKVLKEEERDNLFESLQKENEWIGWAVHACSPQDISESSFRRNKYNLNAIAHDTTIAMIQRVIEQGVNLEEVDLH